MIFMIPFIILIVGAYLADMSLIKAKSKAHDLNSKLELYKKLGKDSDIEL